MSDVILGTAEGIPVEGVGELFWKETGSIMTKGDFPPRYEDTVREDWIAELNRRVQTGEIVFEPTYEQPSDMGLALTLVLDEPFREEGFECYSIDSYGQLLGDQPEHNVTNPNSGNSKPHFPDWFMEFLHDLGQWVNANNVTCFDDGPPETSRPYGHLDIEVTFVHDDETFGMGLEQGAVPIKNHDVFIGSVAVHLSSLKAAHSD